MIETPDKFIPDFVTDNTEYIVVHAEACTHLHRTIQLIKSYGIKAGVALNPATSLSVLDYIFEDLDLVLIMSVNPGFGGQKFIPSALDKARALKKMKEERNPNLCIEIDGGVGLGNVAEIMEAGVDMFVAGSAVFGAEDIPARCRDFQAILKK